jgi:hypothetical protein
MQSTLHLVWVWEYCSTSLDLLRYTASDVLETFPFPVDLESPDLIKAGKDYIQARDEIRLGRNISVNEIYNRFHENGEKAEEILYLRKLHIALDRAVASAYDWADLELGHAFRETKQGQRFTISESAQRKVLDRLLALNHARHAEELAEEAILGKQPKLTARRGRKAKVQDAHDGVTLFSEVGE